MEVPKTAQASFFIPNSDGFFDENAHTAQTSPLAASIGSLVILGLACLDLVTCQ